MKKLVAAAFVSLMLVSGGAFAAPTATQVETAIQQQNWPKADSELREVLQAHPDNARAHYLYAQVLSEEGRHADALTQIQQAKTLDPQVRFTDPSRFAQTEARIRSDAARAGAVASTNTTGTTHNPFAQQSSSGDSQQAMLAQEAPARHGPSTGMWIGIIVLIGAIALVLRWTLRRARSQSDSSADDERRTQLKRATDLLNDVRSLKLDVRLSTTPGHEQLEKEVEGMETQLRDLVQGLSDRKNPVPPYQLDDLERQLASLKARAEGRPDPNATAPGYASNPNDSSYAREADAQFGRQVPPGQPYPYPPQYPPQQQPPVIIQQPGGGFGGGMGGLLTGVLLGEALNSGRDRVVERDVIVDDERHRGGGNAGGDDSQVDFGQGSNDWSDDGSGGNVDMGSDDSNNWNDT